MKRYIVLIGILCLSGVVTLKAQQERNQGIVWSSLRGLEYTVKAEDGRIDKFVEDRYASWKTGIGADIISGKATMADLEKYALEKGEVTASLTSGRQEMLESILNNIMFSL